MQKFIRRTATALLIGLCVLTAAIVGATVKLYTASGEGYCYESESQDIAKKRAVDKAVKKATKEAGVYLKSYSRTVNSELTDDEVTAITSNAWQLVGEPKFTREIINHSGDTQIIVWKATVEVNVDDSEVQSWIKRDGKDKSTIISQTNEAIKSSEENDKKIEDLREKYNRATTQSERDSIIKQMNDADRDFLANQKLEEGNKLAYAKDFNGAIKLYNESLELKPNWDWAYLNRGDVYGILRQFELAIQDYDKAIEINPEFYQAYNNRGNAYNDSDKYERGIQDYDKAIEINPNWEYPYNNRGVAYQRLKQYERAIQDHNKAIVCNPNFANAYFHRGVAYQRLEQYERAIQDFSKAIELNPNNDWSYLARSAAYKAIGDNEKAQKDRDKVEEMLVSRIMKNGNK